MPDPGKLELNIKVRNGMVALDLEDGDGAPGAWTELTPDQAMAFARGLWDAATRAAYMPKNMDGTSKRQGLEE